MYYLTSMDRVGAQLGMSQMITVDIKIPNRMVGLGELSCVIYNFNGSLYISMTLMLMSNCVIQLL